VTVFGDRAFTDATKIEGGHYGWWALIQHDRCPQKRRKLGHIYKHVDTQRDDHREKEGGLRRRP
jgi:hypothetical protein